MLNEVSTGLPITAAVCDLTTRRTDSNKHHQATSLATLKARCEAHQAGNRIEVVAVALGPHPRHAELVEVNW